MPAKIYGTYTLANGDKLFISGLTEAEFTTTQYNTTVYTGESCYINNVELCKTNGMRVDVTELVIELEKDEFLLSKCA
ncbi:MAG: hypothetical protein M0D57_21035 [Sphingobacteriales bacterium JAD_PAG50586_3]|nr:MAG: hypothetical protein M0D57_21035 [Sphingobacteriales bacterium JAD_PAG50586_3]